MAAVEVDGVAAFRDHGTAERAALAPLLPDRSDATRARTAVVMQAEDDLRTPDISSTVCI